MLPGRGRASEAAQTAQYTTEAGAFASEGVYKVNTEEEDECECNLNTQIEFLSKTRLICRTFS